MTGSLLDSLTMIPLSRQVEQLRPATEKRSKEKLSTWGSPIPQKKKVEEVVSNRKAAETSGTKKALEGKSLKIERESLTMKDPEETTAEEETTTEITVVGKEDQWSASNAKKKDICQEIAQAKEVSNVIMSQDPEIKAHHNLKRNRKLTWISMIIDVLDSFIQILTFLQIESKKRGGKQF